MPERLRQRDRSRHYFAESMSVMATGMHYAKSLTIDNLRVNVELLKGKVHGDNFTRRFRDLVLDATGLGFLKVC